MNGGAMEMEAAGAARIRRSRLTLVAVFAVFVLPLALAWVMNFASDWVPRATINHGHLVEPVTPVHLAGWQDPEGRSVDAAWLSGKWTLAYRIAGGCADDCHQVLYVLRQVRLAQGKNIDRVQRLVVLDAPASPAWISEVQEHYPGLMVVQPASAGAVSGIPAPGKVYLIDPLGDLMMEYGADADARGMVKDLERLLRISYVG